MIILAPKGRNIIARGNAPDNLRSFALDCMKIFVVRKDYVLAKGGAERFTKNLILGLAQGGAEVHLITTNLDEAPPQGVVVHSFSVPKKPSHKKNSVFVEKSREILLQNPHSYSIAISATYPTTIFHLGDGIHKHWLKVKSKNPFSKIFDSFSLRHKTILDIEKNILEGGHKFIVTNSHLCKRHATQYYHIPPENIFVNYTGIDLELFNPGVLQYRNTMRKQIGIEENTFLVGYASNNFQRKGLATMIRAMALLQKRIPDCCLLVLGQDKKASLYQAMARFYKIEDKVKFLGNKADIEKYYAMMDVFVLPTLYDPCATVVLEALACGIPSISTTNNGASELIQHGTNGFILDDARDHKQLSIQLFLLSDEKLRKEFAARTYSAVENLTIRTNSQIFVDLLEKYHGESPIPQSFQDHLEKDFPCLQKGNLSVRINKKYQAFIEESGFLEKNAFVDEENRTRTFRSSKKEIYTLESSGYKIWQKLNYSPETDQELEKCLMAQRAGIDTVEVLAAGHTINQKGERVQFFLSMDLKGYRKLEEFIPLLIQKGISFAIHRLLCRIVQKLAEFSANLHQMGLNHQDWYMGHIFFQCKGISCEPGEIEKIPDSFWLSDPEFSLRLLDFQRLQAHRGKVPQRKIVKDLGQLHYSAMYVGLPATYQMRFIKQYSGIVHLSQKDKKFIKKILAKSCKIKKHEPAALQQRRIWEGKEK
ncbi:MAG: glycosyltransferase [Candidatus Brocadiae bacterium]|nr:glycosyltransferase [Candidatus Brocadiia bacterium]